MVDEDDDEKALAEARVGTTINDTWQLDELLGVGGMATVYASTHRDGSRAALKILHVELAGDPGICQRFLREGYVANQIEHRGRVAILGDDVTELGEPFLVMELLEGQTVAALCGERGPRLPPVIALSITEQVLDVLQSFHGHGIVHRDLKPANVFITREGVVKLLDFGVARLREAGRDRTMPGTALGTPAYMSPEQAMGFSEGVDARTDVFSVGATLFTMLSGELIHQGRTETESFLLAARQVAPPIATVAPELDARLRALVDKALAWDPDSRFESAEAMRAEVLSVLDALRTSSAPSPAPVALELEEIEDDYEERPSERPTLEPPGISALVEGTAPGAAAREPAPASSRARVNEPAPASSRARVNEPAPASSRARVNEPAPASIRARVNEPAPASIRARPPEPAPASIRARLPEPSAEGTLEGTPFAHLLVYLLDQRLTGTTLLRGPDGSTSGIYFERGVPMKVQSGAQVAPLDAILLEFGLVDEAVLRETLAASTQQRRLHGAILVERDYLDPEVLHYVLRVQVARKLTHLFDLPRATGYAYYDGVNLLAAYGGPEPTPCDLLEVLMAGVRRSPDGAVLGATLGRFEGLTLELQPGIDLRRFAMSADEEEVCRALARRPMRPSEVVACNVAPPDVVRRTLYVLAITRHIAAGGAARPPVGVDEESPVSARGGRISAGPPSPPSATARSSAPPSATARSSAPPSSRPSVPDSRAGRPPPFAAVVRVGKSASIPGAPPSEAPRESAPPPQRAPVSARALAEPLERSAPSSSSDIMDTGDRRAVIPPARAPAAASRPPAVSPRASAPPAPPARPHAPPTRPPATAPSTVPAAQAAPAATRPPTKPPASPARPPSAVPTASAAPAAPAVARTETGRPILTSSPTPASGAPLRTETGRPMMTGSTPAPGVPVRTETGRPMMTGSTPAPGVPARTETGRPMMTGSTPAPGRTATGRPIVPSSTQTPAHGAVVRSETGRPREGATRGVIASPPYGVPVISASPLPPGARMTPGHGLASPGGTSPSGRPPASPSKPPTADASSRASTEPTEVRVRRALMEQRLRVIEDADFYQMLNIPRDAAKELIQQAYFNAAKTWHPDRLAPELADMKPRVSRVFARFNDAFQTLSDANKRAEYERSVAAGGGDDQDKVARVMDAALEFQKAEVLLKKRDLDSAETLVRRALSADPDQPEYVTLLCWIQAQKRGDPPPLAEGATTPYYDDLIKMLDKVLTKEPRYERALFYRGMLLKRAGRSDKAIRDFRLAAEVNPKNLDAVREVRLHGMRKRGSGEHPASGGLFGRFFKK